MAHPDFPNLNHLFLPAKTGGFSEYTKLETTVIPDEVITVLADSLEARTQGEREHQSEINSKAAPWRHHS